MIRPAMRRPRAVACRRCAKLEKDRDNARALLGAIAVKVGGAMTMAHAQVVESAVGKVMLIEKRGDTWLVQVWDDRVLAPKGHA